MKHARGYALYVVMMMSAAVATTGAIVSTRIAARLAAAPADDARARLLWLARTAAARGRAGGGSVQVAGDRVRLDVAVVGARVIAKAKSAAGTAVVTRDEGRYEERYQRAR